MTCKVHIQHGNDQNTFEVRRGLGFQALAVRQKIPVEFDCRKADCGICLINVVEGAEHLSEPTPAEADFLRAMGGEPGERLACQASILGDVVIEALGVAGESNEGIQLSPEALAQSFKLQEGNAAYQGLPLRLYIEGKGCDGFYYGVTFDEPSEADHRFPQGGIDVIVDPDTLKFTAGSRIDWVDDERGQGFLVDNPTQKHYRGKFYKQETWQKRLLEDRPES